MQYSICITVYNTDAGKSASIRARKNLQELKQLCGIARKEILEEIKKHEDNAE